MLEPRSLRSVPSEPTRQRVESIVPSSHEADVDIVDSLERRVQELEWQNKLLLDEIEQTRRSAAGDSKKSILQEEEDRTLAAFEKMVLATPSFFLVGELAVSELRAHFLAETLVLKKFLLREKSPSGAEPSYKITALGRDYITICRAGGC